MERADPPARRPVLLAVDDERGPLNLIEEALCRRYAADYRVVCHASSADALRDLEAMRAAGEPVAAVLAAQWPPPPTGSELLARARDLHPHAKRALLVDWGSWGDPATVRAIL